MKSKLSIVQFRNKIKENTKIGSPKFKSSLFGVFTMFDGSSETFYGLIDESNFRLTMNTTLYPTFYVIKGKYKNVNSELYIDYSVESNNKFQLIWMKYFPFVLLFVFNIMFILNQESTPILVSIVFNLFIIFIIFFSRWDINQKKKKLEKKFIEIFEIIP
jgi:hypothetical protein